MLKYALSLIGVLSETVHDALSRDVAVDSHGRGVNRRLKSHGSPHQLAANIARSAARFMR
ncbi:MAG: hypothetical protein JWP30_1540 [Homoserinimonas sp.]|nr:hypothetical protein [Homoserinimonas sp.]